MGLLDGIGAEELLDSILNRAARLLGVRSGYVYLGEPGDTHLTVARGDRRHGRRTSASGCPIDQGVGGKVFTNRASRSSSTTTTRSRARHPRCVGRGRRGASACRSRSAGASSGVLGPRFRDGRERVFRQPEVDALMKFAQLASIALENARLHEQALSPRDPVTGLPTRETLIQRVVDALATPPAGHARRAGRRRCSSTSTGSRSSTRASATPRATACCARSAQRISAVPRAERHRRAIRRRHVRRSCCRAATPTARWPSRSASSSSSSRRSTSTAGRGSSARAWASRSARRAAPAAATSSRRPRSRSSARSATRPAASRMFDPLSSRHALERLDVEAELWTRPRARRADGPLPADPRPPDAARRRLRGARPLAAPVARPRPAGRLHRPRRGIRADRRDRAGHPREGLPPGAGCGASAGRTRTW